MFGLKDSSGEIWEEQLPDHSDDFSHFIGELSLPGHMNVTEAAACTDRRGQYSYPEMVSKKMDTHEEESILTMEFLGLGCGSAGRILA